MILPRPGQYSPLDEAQTRDEIERDARQTIKRGQDIELVKEKLIVRSPDGTRFYPTVSNAGALSVARVDGTPIPVIYTPPLVKSPNATEFYVTASNAGVIGLERVDGTPIPPVIEAATVVTTLSGAQVVNQGVWTIIDADTTVRNDDTTLYTVGTTGRITVSRAGIYLAQLTAVVSHNSANLNTMGTPTVALTKNATYQAMESKDTQAVGAVEVRCLSFTFTCAANDVLDARFYYTQTANVGSVQVSGNRLGNVVDTTLTVTRLG